MFAFGGDEEEDDILSAMAAAQYGEEDEPGQVHVSAAKQDTQNNMDEPKAEEGGIMKHYCGDNDIWNPRTRAPDIWFSNTWKDAVPANVIPHELLRKKTLQLVRNNFNKILTETTFEDSTDKLNQAFEKWYFTAKSHEKAPTDPLLTSKIDEATEKQLADSLAETGMPPATATTVAHQVSKFASHTYLQYVRQVNHFGFTFDKSLTNGSSLNTKHVSRTVGVNMGNGVMDTSMILLKYRKSKQRITVQHFEKLKALLNIHVDKLNDRMKHNLRWEKIVLSDQDINDRIFSLLLRYNAINGTYTEGAGFQAAIPGACFDALLKHLDCCMECFASPLNCRYSTFCSAFPDTDAMFGSVGSFFAETFTPEEGSFEANPPFVDALIYKMAVKMNLLLSQANKNRKPLSFVVIIPEWDQTQGWNELNDSKYLRNHIVLQQRDHGYTEGAQHVLSNSRFRIATFNTSIFVLQSKRGKKKWPVTDDFVEELKKSFVSKHKDNTEYGNSKKRGREEDATDANAQKLPKH